MSPERLPDLPRSGRERAIDAAWAECSSTADVRSRSQFMRGASLCTRLQTVALGEVVGLRERLTGKHRFGVVFQGVDGLLEGGEQILDLGLVTLGRAQLCKVVVLCRDVGH